MKQNTTNQTEGLRFIQITGTGAGAVYGLTSEGVVYQLSFSGGNPDGWRLVSMDVEREPQGKLMRALRGLDPIPEGTAK